MTCMKAVLDGCAMLLSDACTELGDSVTLGGGDGDSGKVGSSGSEST